jgi:hypothetical protein
VTVTGIPVIFSRYATVTEQAYDVTLTKVGIQFMAPQKLRHFSPKEKK